jgi:serine palmitoyltransferase
MTNMKIELKKKYKYRLILDESWSFGVLGRNGRGVTEYFGISPSDVDMIIGSMSTTLCGGGGFCAGTKEVVDHQVHLTQTYEKTNNSELLRYHMYTALQCLQF